MKASVSKDSVAVCVADRQDNFPGGDKRRFLPPFEMKYNNDMKLDILLF